MPIREEFLDYYGKGGLNIASGNKKNSSGRDIRRGEGGGLIEGVSFLRPVDANPRCRHSYHLSLRTCNFGQRTRESRLVSMFQGLPGHSLRHTYRRETIENLFLLDWGVKRVLRGSELLTKWAVILYLPSGGRKGGIRKRGMLLFFSSQKEESLVRQAFISENLRASGRIANRCGNLKTVSGVG